MQLWKLLLDGSIKYNIKMVLIKSITKEFSVSYQASTFGEVKNGVEINFEKECVYLRKSNNEPIIRIYTESISQDGADQLAIRFVDKIKNCI